MPIIGCDIDEAARRLCDGQIVAFATETVYGLGALAVRPDAVQKVYTAKGRPLNHPCIIHLAEISEADKWADIPDIAQQLAAAFMPGPLTLILPDKHGGTVALRIPDHPQARQLLATVGDGVIAPSANRFGRLSPTTAAHVFAEFENYPDLYILDGGACKIGIESTIVSCLNDEVAIIRPGIITATNIRAYTPLSPSPPIAAPGTLAAHYAPRKPLTLIAPDEIAAANDNVAVLSRHRPPTIPREQWIQAAASAADYARLLYSNLRQLDNSNGDIIWVETPPTTSEWEAIRDRLARAKT